jgi:hypothetical protein
VPLVRSNRMFACSVYLCTLTRCCAQGLAPFCAIGPDRPLWHWFHAPGCIRVSEKTSSSRICLVNPNGLHSGVPRGAKTGREAPLWPLFATTNTRSRPLQLFSKQFLEEEFSETRPAPVLIAGKRKRERDSIVRPKRFRASEAAPIRTRRSLARAMIR